MNHYFLSSIEHLRKHEEIMLYGNIMSISPEEQELTISFLQNEFNSESIQYPFEIPPTFNAALAIWAAKIVYFSSQFMLNRSVFVDDIKELLLPYQGNIESESDLLSADIILRFLPAIINQIQLIDPEDPMIPILETHLKTWHYSGISYPFPLDEINFDNISQNEYLIRMYTDRVISNKNKILAMHPTIQPSVKSSLGLHAASYWKEINFNEQI